MIELSKEQLRQLQLVELEILMEVDRVCRKNHIHYSITGGTLLGAERHGGFIPWDDDADISMLRSEYIRFKEACEKEIDHSRFYFQDMDSTEGYRWGYGKVRRKDSLFLREYQEHMPYEQGIFIDVFPRDGIPDNRVEKVMHTVCCFVLRKALWSEIGKKKSESLCERCLYFILSKIPMGVLKKQYQLLIKWSNHRPRRLVRALTFPLPKGVEGYNRSWYRKYRNIEFEGMKLMAETSYKKWLRREFGDYMSLPPKDKRKVHPVSAISFPKEKTV